MGSAYTSSNNDDNRTPAMIVPPHNCDDNNDSGNDLFTVSTLSECDTADLSFQRFTWTTIIIRVCISRLPAPE